METKLVLELLKIAIVIGAPTLMKLIEELNKDKVTLEDIQRLQFIVKKPESYFK